MSTTTMTAKVEASRKLESLLAGIEKRCLVWLAHRMPARVNSDHLTLLGLLGMLGAGLSFWGARQEPFVLFGVVLFLAVNWFGDSLDGTLARVRRQQRPMYGFYVDHVVDVFGTFFLLGGLALSGYMSTSVAVGLMVAYLMVTAEVYLATYAVGTFHLSHFGVGPTELRILLAIGTLTLLVRPEVTLFGNDYLLFDVGGLVAIAGLAVTLIASVIKNTKHLYLAEPLP